MVWELFVWGLDFCAESGVNGSAKTTRRENILAMGTVPGPLERKVRSYT